MSENKKPDWWPKNPYTNQYSGMIKRSLNEQVWEMASDACYEAWSKAMKEMWKKFRLTMNPIEE